jgi:SNF2 family DNA or RNA helicase
MARIAANWIAEKSAIAFSIIDRVDRSVFDTYRACVTGARWNPDMRANLAALDTAMVIAHKLTKEGFAVEFDDDAAREIDSKKNVARAELNDAEARLTRLQTRLAKEGKALYPFQVEGVKRLAWRDRYLLADDMGLGKTVQAIVAIPEGSPVVIVCPSIAKAVWEREFRKWRPDFKVKSVSGRGKFAWPEVGNVVIVNYDILPSEALTEKATVRPGTVVVADEAHYLKSSKSGRTRSFRAMASKVRDAGGKVWLLTGTPLLNKPPELWSVLSAADLARDAFGNWDEFMYQFSAYKD